MRRTVRTGVLVVLLLVFWQVLSARIDPLFLVMGVVSTVVVAWFTMPLLDEVLGTEEDEGRFDPFALLVYIVWLFIRQVVAGFHIAWAVLSPGRRPVPGVFTFETGLDRPAALALLANSITLVPGTNTIEVEGDRFTVHAFDAKSAADLADAKVQRRIARIFRLPPDDPPVLTWSPPYDPSVDDQRPDGEVAR